MDLRRLRHFVAVAEERSVGKAALRLGMAQPPLSVQIRKLELDLGTPLFRRGSRGMEMTDAGAVLLTHAKQALAIASEGVAAARAVAAGKRGRMTVGYMFVLAYALLPQLVRRLRAALPDVALDFVEMTAETRERLVLERRVTVALCMPPLHHPEIDLAVIGADPLMAAVPARSPLARLPRVPVAKLHGCRLVGLPRTQDGSAGTAVSALLRRHGVSVRLVQSVETVYSALGLVMAGDGIAILPRSAALARPPGVVFRPLQDGNDVLEIAACWRRDMHGPLLLRFLSVVRELSLPMARQDARHGRWRAVSL